jgi:hypothetical protein
MRFCFVAPISLDIGEPEAHPSLKTMTIRITRTTVTFQQPFLLKGASIEMLVVDPQDLDAAQDRERKASIP